MRNAVFLCNDAIGQRASHSTNFVNLHKGQYSLSVSFSTVGCAVQDAIGGVLFLCRPSQMMWVYTPEMPLPATMSGNMIGRGRGSMNAPTDNPMGPHIFPFLFYRCVARDMTFKWPNQTWAFVYVPTDRFF